MKVPRRPCGECPWRQDTEPGQFPASRYEALRSTTIDDDGNHAGFDAAMFACHKSGEGEEFICAGWLASVGMMNIRVRLLVSAGEIPVEALSPGDDWPPLFDDYDEMASTQGGLTTRTDSGTVSPTPRRRRKA